jgi:ZIP family zinc transporter
VLQAGLWALLAASSLVVGAVVAEAVRVSDRVLGAAMGFGSGALLGALAYELVPTEHVAEGWIWFSFGLGAAVFYVADRIVEKRGDAAPGSGIPIALGALLDGVPESVVLGMSVAVGGSVSIGFLVAVFVSNVPESLSATAEMRATRSRTWVLELWIGIAIVSAIAGALGYLLAERLSVGDGGYVEALAGGAVLTMLASSLMPDAFEKGGPSVALFTALGFAIAAVLTLLE